MLGAVSDVEGVAMNNLHFPESTQTRRQWVRQQALAIVSQYPRGEIPEHEARRLEELSDSAFQLYREDGHTGLVRDDFFKWKQD